jgi:hypothetical protein
MNESVHDHSGFSRLQCEERKIGAQLDELIRSTKTVSGDTPNPAFEIEATKKGDGHSSGKAENSLET